MDQRTNFEAVNRWVGLTSSGSQYEESFQMRERYLSQAGTSDPFVWSGCCLYYPVANTA